jgi:hypothetical protein
MGLRPTKNGDLHIPGLYFLPEEYDSLLQIWSNQLPTLAQDLRDWVFVVSSGHIGAIDSILATVKRLCVRTLFLSSHFH